MDVLCRYQELLIMERLFIQALSNLGGCMKLQSIELCVTVSELLLMDKKLPNDELFNEALKQAMKLL